MLENGILDRTLSNDFHAGHGDGAVSVARVNDLHATNGHGERRKKTPTLAMICFETPDSPVGRYVGRLALALAERLSAIKQRGRANISRDDLVALLEELAAGDIDVDELRRNPEHAPERYRIRLAEPDDGGRTRPRAAPGDLANETF